MSKKKLFRLLTGMLTLGGASPALANGEWFSGGFAGPNPLNWTYDSVTMSTNYLDSYVKPAAGPQWNGVSSKVQMVFVTSGSYWIKVLLATSPDPSAVGLFHPYCAEGSGDACLNSTWTSGRVYGYENSMAANGFNTTERISNFTHEFGHSLSMQHVTASGVNAVMRQGKQALGTQSYDKTNLQGKWGF